ncbi:MAG: CvpA family protein [Mariprofundaceae bacterium]|nr:CvpA family protein [Mariprofundaceae bacterium]
MSFLDISLLAIIGLAVLQGMMRGFIAELIAVAGTVGAFFAAAKASGNIADKLVDTTGIETTFADPLAFFIVFFAVMMVVGVVVSAVPNLLKGSRRLFFIDHLFGAMIAPVRPIVFIGVVSLIAFTYIEDPSQVFGNKSALRPTVLTIGQAMGNIIPANHPFSAKSIITDAPMIDHTDGAGALPGVKDKKALEKILEKRL